MEKIKNVINDVQWKKIKYSTGTCEYIPLILEDLISASKEKRKDAYWHLDNYVVIQGTLFEGAFYLIPFLLEILKMDSKYGRNEIYDLLYELANGWAQFEKIVSFRPVFNSFEYFVTDDSGIKLPLKIACKTAVSRGWDIFVNDLLSVESEYRVQALELLFLFSEHWDILNEYLNEILNSEENNNFCEKVKEFYDEIQENGI